MTYTIADVGKRIVNGEEVSMTDAEKQAIADEWNVNVARAEAKRAAALIEQKRLAAMRVLQDQVLAAACADPNAPPEVKEYAAALK